MSEEACAGKPQAGFCEGEAYNDAGTNRVALSIPKGERNREYKASLNIEGVLPTRLQGRSTAWRLDAASLSLRRLDRSAEIPLSSEAIEWANIIFVMEKAHRTKLSKHFQPWLKNKRIICLDIPDEYEYMEPALVKLLKQKVFPLIGTFQNCWYKATHVSIPDAILVEA